MNDKCLFEVKWIASCPIVVVPISWEVIFSLHRDKSTISSFGSSCEFKVRDS